MIAAYFLFNKLSDELRLKHNIRSKARLDCIAFNNLTAYNGLTDFVNRKGQMFLYKTLARQIVRIQSKKIAEWALCNGSLNLSSIYFEDTDFPHYGYGYPNANRLLDNGKPNPLFPYRNDCYLFITNTDQSQIEVLVIAGGRPFVQGYYQRLIDGNFNQELQRLRMHSRPFFDYESAL